MQTDFRNDPLFKEAEARTRAWLRPGTGEPSSLVQLMASPDGRRAAAAASISESLEGPPSTRIALINLADGNLEIVTSGPNSDNSPKWSPDGRMIAFLSDRDQPGLNRLRIFDVEMKIDRPTIPVDGFVECAQWSSDGASLLLGVAGYGSELAGSQGAKAIGLDAGEADRPGWTPIVEGAPEATPWRSIWIYDVANDAARQVTPKGLNVWQGVWCGPHHVAAICSDRPEETWWYSADLRMISIDDGEVRRLFRPADQLGWLAVTPSGKTIAVVEAVCSDRNIVAGDLRLIDSSTGAITKAASLGADVVQLHWRSEDRLLFVAARGPETVIGTHDRVSGRSKELWCSSNRSLSGPYFPEIAPLGDNPDDALFISEFFFEAPTLFALEGKRERKIREFGTPETAAAVKGLGSARNFSWSAPDGLEIHGWLITPNLAGPHPLILQVHGGPVTYHRPMYLGRTVLPQMALAAGYALFQPNPRGSSGRGQAFARLVFGDMGGEDTYDYLSGLDALEASGIADPARIGVTGGSYGGFVSAWLISQDERFAAAVPVVPVTDWVSEHLTSNIPSFCEMFLGDHLNNPTGKYYTRSPIHHADKITTPTLNICGALDRITPASQALEFHRAVRGAGGNSVLVTYPQEGHGIRGMPAVFDYVARVIDWFSRHMPAERA